MSRPGGWWRLLAVVAMVVTAMMPATAGAWDKRIAQFPDFGAISSNPDDPDWSKQMQRLHNLKPTMFGTYMTPTYKMTTAELQDAINAGARVIVLRTPEKHESLRAEWHCDMTDPSLDWQWDCHDWAMTVQDVQLLFEQVRRHPVQEWADTQSLRNFIAAHPDVVFYIEIGNEPDVGKDTGLGRDAFDANNTGTFDASDAAAYRERVIAIANWFRTNHSDLKNLRLLASMPVDGDWYIDDILGDGRVEAAVDSFGIHLYGGTTPWDAHFISVMDAVQSETTVPLFVTETGICDPSLSKQTKAQRMRDWYLQNAEAERIAGVLLWVLDHWQNADCGHGYEIESYQAGDPSYMAETFAERFMLDNPAVMDTITYHDLNGIPGYQASTQDGVGDFTTEGPFDAEWWSVGGGSNYSASLNVYGYPITFWDGEDQGWLYSDWRIENGVITQYFERNVMEWHPENALNGQPSYRVLLRRLGVDRAKWKGYLDASGNPVHSAFTPKTAGDPTVCDYFPETGHNLCFGMRDYWKSKGREFGDPGVSRAEAIQLWGYPISEEFTECNGGTCLTTQYFERAVIQYFPNNPPGWQFQGILLGRESLNGLY